MSDNFPDRWFVHRCSQDGLSSTVYFSDMSIDMDELPPSLFYSVITEDGPRRREYFFVGWDFKQKDSYAKCERCGATCGADMALYFERSCWSTIGETP